MTKEELEALDKEFNQNLEKFLNNDLKRSYTFSLGKPVKELQNVGFPDVDIKILQKNVRKIIKEHEIQAHELENLPSVFQRIKAVFRSKQSEKARIVQTDIEKEQAVVFAVWLNNTLENQEVNEIKSGYLKADWILEEWRKQGLLLWEKEKE